MRGGSEGQLGLGIRAGRVKLVRGLAAGGQLATQQHTALTFGHWTSYPPHATMRLLSWASLGLLTALTSADSNLTAQGSQNILASAFKPPQHFRNVNLVRNINVEKSYPRETINVVIENIDAQPQSEYYLPFEQRTAGSVGGLEVKDKKEPERTGFAVDLVEVDPYR